MNTQEYLLTHLAEEASEIVKDACKGLRFGLDDIDPNGDGTTNRERLINELNDMMAIVKRLELEKIIPEGWLSAEKMDVKSFKIRRFEKYSEKRGTLQRTENGKL